MKGNKKKRYEWEKSSNNMHYTINTHTHIHTGIVSHHLELYDSAFIIGILYVNHSNPKLSNISQLLPICWCWCYIFSLTTLSLSLLLLLLCVLSIGIQYFFFVVVRPKQTTVCALCCYHICNTIKCRIFHIKFHGFNRTISAFSSLIPYFY